MAKYRKQGYSPNAVRSNLPRLPIKTRTSVPIAIPTKNGIELHCPFCQDKHVLRPGEESPCGTRVEVTAVQEVFTPHTVKHEKLVCAKCFKGGGEMVRFRNSFVHVENCSPDKVLVMEPPKSSRLARIVYNLPTRLKSIVEKFTGRADVVKEVDEHGALTGVILSYIFWSKPDGNGKPAEGKQIPAGT